MKTADIFEQEIFRFSEKIKSNHCSFFMIYEMEMLESVVFSFENDDFLRIT